MATKDVEVRLRGNVSQYNASMKEASKSTQQFEDTTGKTTSSVGSKWGSAGSMISSSMGLSFAAVGAGAVMLAKTSIDAASNLQESINAVNVSYGESAEAVHALGAEATESFGLSQRAFNEAAVSFTSFAEDIAGEGGNVAGTLGDLMTRSSDFASVLNLDVTEAANAFKSALSGEAEPLKAYGINISDAAVKAHALEEGLIGVGDTMSDQEKVQARYSLLMQETSKTAGDFAATSDGYAGSMKKMKAEVENLAASMGVLLLPVMAKVVGAVADFAAEAQNFGEKIADIPGVTYFIKTLADIPSTLDDFENALFGAAGNLTGINAEAEETTGTFLGYAEGVSAAADVTNTYSGKVHIANAETAAFLETKGRLIGPLVAETDAIYQQIGAYNEMEAGVRAALKAQEEETAAILAMSSARRQGTEDIYAAKDAEDAWWAQMIETNEILAVAETRVGEHAATTRDLATATNLMVSERLIANGVDLESVAGQEAWLVAMLDVAAGLSGPVHDEVMNYIALMSGIPAEKLTVIRAETDLASVEIAYKALHTKFSAPIVVSVSGRNPDRRALGGPISPGTSYLVGEDGPELITPSMSGYVHTASQTAAMFAHMQPVPMSGAYANQSASMGAAPPAAPPFFSGNITLIIEGEPIKARIDRNNLQLANYAMAGRVD